MYRLLVLSLLSLMLVAPHEANAQHRHRPSPAKGKRKHGHKGSPKGPKKHRTPGKHRAPPAPEPDMPVRKPVKLGGFSPAEGAPGTEVVLRGMHFDETVRVRFNGRRARVIGRATTEIRVRVPRRAVTDSFVVTKAGFPDQTTEQKFIVIRPPVIAGVDPRRGPAGTRVQIRGQHFISTDRFLLGAVELPVLKKRDRRVVVQIPDGAVSGHLVVQRGGTVVARSRHRFDVVPPPPVVESFTPTRGSRGAVVRLVGRNFEPSDVVELAGQRLQTRSRGPTHIDVVIRNHKTGQFTVRGRRGRRARAAETFVVVRPPVVARFAPKFGPPGTRISFYGQGFINGDQVVMGAATLTVRTIAHNRIVAELPAGVDSGPMFVQRGRRKYKIRGRFEVTLPPEVSELTPRAAPPGATFVVRGDHFARGVSVVLAGRRLPIVSRRLPNELVVRVPPGARSGEVVVFTRSGSARAPVPFQVSHYAALSSFFPLHGLPGTVVTLRGHHFHPGVKVFLQDQELPLVERRPRTMKVKIPDGTRRSGRIALLSHGRRVVSNLRFRVDRPRPEIEFSFTPRSGRRGSEVTLLISPPRPEVGVYFDGRPMPKKVLADGRRIVVTVPADARTAHFELELGGRRYRSARPFRVR